MWYFINLTLFKFLFFLSILIWYHPCLFFWIYVFFISFNYLFFANFFLSFLFPLIFLFLYSYILSIDLSQIFYPTIFFLLFIYRHFSVCFYPVIADSTFHMSDLPFHKFSCRLFTQFSTREERISHPLNFSNLFHAPLTFSLWAKLPKLHLCMFLILAEVTSLLNWIQQITNGSGCLHSQLHKMQ